MKANQLEGEVVYKQSKRKCKTKGRSTHHWIIDEPNGKLSMGTCKYCNANQEFANSQSYSAWLKATNSNGRYKGWKKQPGPPSPIGRPSQPQLKILKAKTTRQKTDAKRELHAKKLS